MFRRISKAMIQLSLIALFALASILPIRAHHAVLRVNLEEMTTMADRIFVGRCASVEETEEFIAGGMLPVTLYTFEVERPVKGRVTSALTIRHLGHAPRLLCRAP